MRAEIRKAGQFEEVETPERCSIAEVANDAGYELVSIARARVKAGVTTRWHSLAGVSERYLIVAGTGRMEIGGLEAAEVAAGDVARVPAGVPQRITSTGTGDLIFYCICTPPFTPACYTAME